MRCAMCGSKKVTVETKNEGYNRKKGIIGGVLFGSTGAIIGGSSGNTVKYYHCADCGHVLNHAMDSTKSMEITVHIENPEVFKKELIKEKEKYPNIEWEPKKEKYLNMTIEEIVIEVMKEIGHPAKAFDIYLKMPNSIENISSKKVKDILEELKDKSQVESDKVGYDTYFSISPKTEKDLEYIKRKILKKKKEEIGEEEIRKGKINLDKIEKEIEKDFEEIGNLIRTDGDDSQISTLLSKDMQYIDTLGKNLIYDMKEKNMSTTIVLRIKMINFLYKNKGIKFSIKKIASMIDEESEQKVSACGHMLFNDKIALREYKEKVWYYVIP